MVFNIFVTLQVYPGVRNNRLAICRQDDIMNSLRSVTDQIDVLICRTGMNGRKSFREQKFQAGHHMMPHIIPCCIAIRLTDDFVI